MCRLTRPYRATSDLDTVNRRGANEPAQLELLLASGAEASGVSGALVPTPAGNVQVDVLEVTDAELADLPDDPTDRLHVLSHAWAAATATPMQIRATGMPDLTVAVAEFVTASDRVVSVFVSFVVVRGGSATTADWLLSTWRTLTAAAEPWFEELESVCG